MNLKKTKRKGFTLVELMITIFIISIGLVGIMSLIQNTLRSASFVRFNLTGVYLAQEGIELVRNIRDNNWISGRDWKDGLEACSLGCKIAYNNTSLSSYNDEFLQIDDNGFYNHNEGEESNFKRAIFINSKTDSDGREYLEVISQISWSHRGEDERIDLVDHLYNWR